MTSEKASHQAEAGKGVSQCGGVHSGAGSVPGLHAGKHVPKLLQLSDPLLLRAELQRIPLQETGAKA